MATYVVKDLDNYIRITKKADGSFVMDEPKKGIEFEERKPLKYSITYKGITPLEDLAASEFEDKDGVVYTDTTLNDYFRAETGKSSAGGGSAITTKITLAENGIAGEPFYLNALDTWSKGDALLKTKSSTKMLVLLEDGLSGASVSASSLSELTLAGLVADKIYYLNEGGGITHDNKVFQSGSVHRIIGYTGSGAVLHISVDETFLQNGTKLTEQVWKDMVASFNQGKTTGGTSPIWEDTGNGIYAWKFVPGNKLQVSFHVNHDYAQTTDGYLHTHWIHKLAIAAAGATTIWRLGWVRARGHSQGESLTAPLTYIDITHTSLGTEIAGDHIISEADLADAFDLLEPDTLVEVTVELLSTTLADKVYGKMCDIHYLADREGTPNKAPNFYA